MGCPVEGRRFYLVGLGQWIGAYVLALARIILAVYTRRIAHMVYG